MTVFAALLLTCDTAALAALNPTSFDPDNLWNEQAALLATALFAFAAATALCTVFVGTWHYVTAQRYGKDVMHAIDTIVDGTPLPLQPSAQALVSAWSTLLGLCVQVYLLQGLTAFYVALAPLVFVFAISTATGLGTLVFAQRRIDRVATIATFESFEMLYDILRSSADKSAMKDVKKFFKEKELTASGEQLGRYLEFSFEPWEMKTLRANMISAKKQVARNPRLEKVLRGDYEAVKALLKTGGKGAEDAELVSLLRGDLATGLLGGKNQSGKEVTEWNDKEFEEKIQQLAGKTPLLLAAESGNAELVKLLLTRGASTEAVTSSTDDELDGMSALCIAASIGNEDVIDALISGGAKLEARSTNAASRRCIGRLTRAIPMQ